MKEKKKSQVTVSGIVGIVLCIVFIPIIIINLILIIGATQVPKKYRECWGSGQLSFFPALWSRRFKRGI